MERYSIGRTIGEGTYATVLLATRRADGVHVAVKALKKAEAAVMTLEDTLRMREVRALQRLSGHQNIIRLIEVSEGVSE